MRPLAERLLIFKFLGGVGVKAKNSGGEESRHGFRAGGPNVKVEMAGRGVLRFEGR